MINVTVYLDTNHGGRQHMSVCPLPKEQVTQACFDRPEHTLLRADGDSNQINKK